MARIRTIKPEFWSSPGVRGASPWVRLLFIAMWNWADDHGRGTANTKELAAFAFPHDDDFPGTPTSAELPCLLAEIAGRFNVRFYEVAGRRFYAIPSWNDHQKNERRANSRYPSPEEGTPFDPGPPDQGKPAESRNGRPSSAATHGTSAATHGDSEAGTGEQGNRGTGEPPAGHVDQSGPAEYRAHASARARDDVVRDLNGAAQSPRAYRLVKTYRDACPNRPPTKVLNDLGRQIDALIADGIDEHVIETGLHAWAEKNLGPGALPSVVNQILNDPHGAPEPPPPPIPRDPDAELTEAQIVYLSPNWHEPPIPDDVRAGGKPAIATWRRENRPAWMSEREGQARDRIRQREHHRKIYEESLDPDRTRATATP